MSIGERVKKLLSEHIAWLVPLGITILLGTLLTVAFQAGKLVEKVEDHNDEIEQLKTQQESILRRLGDLKCEIRKNSLTRFAALCIEEGGELRVGGLHCLYLSAGESVPFEDPLPDIQRNC